MNMMMQSKFATFGEGVTTTRPVARYAPWVNPYHPLLDEEAYAAAMLEDAKAMPKVAVQRTKAQDAVPRSRYLQALIDLGGGTVPDVAGYLDVSTQTTSRALNMLRQKGLADREQFGRCSITGGKIPDMWWATESAE